MKTTNALKSVLGPLWKLATDDTVDDICIDSYDDVYYYNRKGESHPVLKLFKSQKELESLIEKMLKYSGKSINKETKSIYFSLDDYTKVSVVFPPISLKGPAVNINKIPPQRITLENLVDFKTIDAEGKKVIESILKSDRGILASGKVGSGITTLINVLIDSIPQPNRVITLERFQELKIYRERVCRLQTQNQKSEEVLELVEIAEKMKTDYLVLAECNGPEVMPYLEQIRNTCTGLTLIKAENALDALKRLETKAILSSEGMSSEDARYAISQAFGYVIFQEKRGAMRIISTIAEIQYESGELKLRQLYKR